jgi:hypothetical protein
MASHGKHCTNGKPAYTNGKHRKNGRASVYKWQAALKHYAGVGVQMASTWKMAAIGYTNGHMSETLLRVGIKRQALENKLVFVA